MTEKNHHKHKINGGGNFRSHLISGPVTGTLSLFLNQAHGMHACMRVCVSTPEAINN